MTHLPYFAIWEAVRFIIFERLICVFGGYSPMPTPVHNCVLQQVNDQQCKFLGVHQSRQWVMGQLGQQMCMGHVGHGSVP